VILNKDVSGLSTKVISKLPKLIIGMMSVKNTEVNALGKRIM